MLNINERVAISPDISWEPTESLEDHPQNARKGNVDAIAQSIRDHGFNTAILAQKSTRRILIGRHRRAAAAQVGMETVPVRWVECDNEEALRIILADNRASDVATYDDTKLLGILKDLGDMQGTLWDQDSYDDVAYRAGAIAPITEVPFTGGYADEGKELEERQKRSERIAEQLKDVLMLMKPDLYVTFMEHLRLLQKRWGTSGVSATVLAAVAQCAGEQKVAEAGAPADLDAKVAAMQGWREKLTWAISPSDREQFEADFA